MLRPNWAMDAPPTEIMVGGVSYAVNSDYRVWIEIMELMRQLHSDPSTPERQQQNALIAERMQILAFGGVLVDENFAEVLMAISNFSQGYPTAPMGGGEPGPDVYSFKWDLNEILIAIRNQSGLDLSYRCEYFHWWEFLLEFRTLCGDHYILNLMEARGYRGEDKEMRKRQRRCALPVEHTADQQAALEEINDLFSGAV